MTTRPSLTDASRSLRLGSKSFAGAARLFPPDIRASVTLLYAWCRHCDDVIDGQVLGSAPDRHAPRDAERALRFIEEHTRLALAGRAAPGTPFEGLAFVAERHAIPERYPLELLDGFAMDVRGRRYDRFEDTVDYAYHVAGTVGVMMGLVMGVRDTGILKHACDLGIAFQLTNIARDVADDGKLGRVYIPRAWLDEEGANADDPAHPDSLPETARAVARLLDSADGYYASARAGLPHLPLRCALAVGAALSIYRGIGAKVRRAGPDAWVDRVSTSSREKARLAAGGVALALGARTLSLRAAASDRMAGPSGGP